jgi:hypothetical protein
MTFQLFDNPRLPRQRFAKGHYSDKGRPAKSFRRDILEGYLN